DSPTSPAGSTTCRPGTPSPPERRTRSRNGIFLSFPDDRNIPIMNPPHRNSPVSSQDKIKELAMAALRAAPAPGGAPKPAGFTPVAQPLTETPSDETLPTQAS